MNSSFYAEDEDETFNSTLDYNEELHFLCKDHIQDSASTATAFCFIVIFCLSIVGNTLVLCVLTKFEKLRKVTNLFVLNLAISDLIFAVALPFWSTYHLSHWIFGNFLCKVMSGTYFIGLYSSMMFLTAMTIDRYVIVVHNQLPLLKKRRLLAQITCLAIWTISLSISIREMVISSAKLDKCGYIICESFSDPLTDKVSTFSLTSIFFIIPLVIIVYCYCRILMIVVTLKIKKKQKSVTLIFCIVVAFFVCWGPYNLVMLMLQFQSSSEELYQAFFVCRIIAYFHCCFNPLLYAFVQKFSIASAFLCLSAAQVRDRQVQRRTHHVECL